MGVVGGFSVKISLARESIASGHCQGQWAIPIQA